MRFRSAVSRLLTAVLSLAVVVALPFVVLVRISVHFHVSRGLQTWLALGVGGLATLVVLTTYAVWISKKLTGRLRAVLLAKRVVFPLVVAYCLYALLYLSSLNAKSEEVRTYYRSLHPLMRVALSTIILVDRDIVVTDLTRTPQDYAAMGLPPQQASLHYRQADGYVHALDLRTIGRGGWSNWAVASYFGLMGFNTLRHIGTADHLHVSLPLTASR